MRPCKPRSALALAALLAATAGGAPPTLAQTFVESTSVVVVQVPVNVLIDGKPVRGLARDDFVLLDGRKEQEITGFEVVDLMQTPSTPRLGAPGRARSGAIPAGGRRHFLLLFDLSFSEPENLVAAREAARRLVREQLHPSDLIAVATYARSQGSRLLLGFTPDRDQAELAIDTLGLPQLYETANDPLALLIGELEGTPRPRPGDRPGAVADREIAEALRQFSESMQRQDRRREQSRIALLGRSMGDLARLLHSVEGRKQVVYLSEGFDSSALFGTQDPAAIEALSRASEQGRVWEIDSEERFGDSRSQNLLEEMFEEFRRAGSSIQAVDIGGLRSEADVAFGSSRATAAGTATRDSRRDGLAVMAPSTGGELFRSFNDLSQAMGRLLEHTSVTYLLAFEPARLELDGRYHRLKVKLKESPAGVTIVHRPGYYAPVPYSETPAAEIRLRTAELILGGGEGGAFDSAVMAAPIRAAGPSVFVPVLVEIEGRGLMASSTGGVLPIELFVYALGPEGRIGDFLVHSATVDLAQARPVLQRSGLKFFGHLELPPGEWRLRVLVRNRISGLHSLRGLPLRVPDFAAGGPVLLPALVAEPFDRWMVTREEGIEARPYPFIIAGQPFLPAVRPELAPGTTVETAVLGYGLGTGELTVDGRAIAADGSELELDGIRIAERAAGPAGAEGLRVVLDPGMLEAGEYRLQITVTDAATGRSATSTTPFVVASGPARP